MRIALFYVLLLGLSGAATAHHAFSADYDINLTGTIKGVVADVFFQNPHVHYFITVSNIDGSSETWDAQAYNLNIMSRRGWNANTLKVGDTVTVVGNLGRDERRLIAIQQVEKSDGTTLAIFDR